MSSVLNEMKGLTWSSEVPSQPKYEQLRGYMVSQIESGAIKPGSALPSESKLAESLQVARNTIRQALAALEQEGLIHRIHGKGTFVHDEARQRIRKGLDLLALIVPETDTAFYPSLQRSFEKAAVELHNQVIVCNTNGDIDKQASAILQLIDLRVSGVAIVPTASPVTPALHIRHLQQHGIPVVCCSRAVVGAQTPLLAIPFEEVGRLAGEAIREAGHHRVAYLSKGQSTASTAYEKGFREAMGSKADVSVFVATCPPTDYPALQEESAMAIEELFRRDAPPTTLFCSFDSLAEWAYLQVLKLGLRVPEDVSVVGFGGTFRGGGLASQLASVTVDEIGLGTQAVELLTMMRRGEVAIDANESRQLAVSFRNGGTLGPCSSGN
ncbi:LacI family transcriptional regulator [Blastopirellula sp. J2-11]|uniref:GntR family transcriptional regulator n=1 Tax=Blastopirellula sp. J2-11 TaxID=2943192 RepID=UPI0021C98EF5|nr:LacI family DNA-binding transcriptional regulator [Blastopirellula sp. J2-11]UUO04538.1 LacI family transcriptional regulator [Blastopirellula sp. J2-11]